MDLKGEYQSFSDITDVLELLSSSGKSGRLSLSFESEDVGFYLSKGKLFEIKINMGSLSDIYRMYKSKAISLKDFAFIVLYSIENWHNGTFSFSEEKPKVDDGLSMQDILMTFGKRKDELEKLKNLAKGEKRVRISRDVNVDFLRLNRFDWHILYSSACKSMPVKTFFSRKVPEVFVLSELKKLLDYGLITVN